MTRRLDTLRSLSRPTQRYITAVCASAAGAVAAVAVAAWQPPLDWALLGVLVALCVGGKWSEILAPGHYSLQPSYAALVWGCLLEPSWVAPILALACFAPDLFRGETATYKVVFNVANYTIVGVIVSLFAVSADFGEAAFGFGPVLAAFGAAAAGALVNHGLIVVAIALAGEQPLRGTFKQLTDGLPLSVGVGLTGAVMAVLYTIDPALLILAVGPVGLLYRALWVPMLRHQADTDPKTGLYHSERIREELSAQIEAARSGGRVAVAMIDLDHLRAINSRCGHLAGDRAIRAVADALAEVAAQHGAAGRFGGEEFCLVLPGLSAPRAKALLDGVRHAVRAVDFRETDRELLVTFSAGIAVFPDHGDTDDAVLTAADVALYDAKAAGRDRVRIALSEASRGALEDLDSGSVPPSEQPLPAASVAGSRLVAAARVLGGRRATDRDAGALGRARSELGDALGLVSRMQQSFLQAILMLARALEDKDPFAAGSTDRVADITVRLASELRYTDVDVRALTVGAALRDVGKAGVREAILHKHGHLDPLEREEVRSHADFASRLVAELELPVVVKHMVRSHHERWDGAGYPDHLAGEDIPLAARILAVADALDAMLSPRPYRPAMDLAEARAEIRGGAGSQFCPRVAQALERCLDHDPGWMVSVAVHPSKFEVDGLQNPSAASR
jgi:diguanylate cyclase (GGDEF)-like protein